MVQPGGLPGDSSALQLHKKSSEYRVLSGESRGSGPGAKKAG